MPANVVAPVAEALNERSRPLKGSRVLLLGAAYKKDIDDPRESPAFELLERLEAAGAVVSYHDPYIPSLPAMRHHTIRLDSVELSPGSLAATDCVLICTDHSCYDWELVVRHAPLVVDTRNATRGVADGREKIVRA